MLRMPDEKALKEFLARSKCKVAGARIVGGMRGVSAEAPPPPAIKPKRIPKPPKIRLEADVPGSRLERMMVQQLTLTKAPDYIREHRFDTERKWRFDFAWPVMKIAIEVEGGVHRIKGRFKGDIEKYNEAMLQGWSVIRVAQDEIKGGLAIAWLERLIKLKEKTNA